MEHPLTTFRVKVTPQRKGRMRYSGMKSSRATQSTWDTGNRQERRKSRSKFKSQKLLIRSCPHQKYLKQSLCLYLQLQLHPPRRKSLRKSLRCRNNKQITAIWTGIWKVTSKYSAHRCKQYHRTAQISWNTCSRWIQRQQVAPVAYSPTVMAASSYSPSRTMQGRRWYRLTCNRSRLQGATLQYRYLIWRRQCRPSRITQLHPWGKEPLCILVTLCPFKRHLSSGPGLPQFRAMAPKTTQLCHFNTTKQGLQDTAQEQSQINSRCSFGKKVPLILSASDLASGSLSDKRI